MRKISFSATLSLLLCFISNWGNAQLSVGFSADFVEICAPGVIQFTDNSSSTAAPITQWIWKRDGVVFSNLQDPSLFFGSPGSYNICLIASDNLGNTDSLCISNYIVAYQSPTANFSADALVGCTPLGVNFADLSILGDAPIQEWRWDFGDGNIDTVNQHPSHTYTTLGTFDVTLVVIDTNGCSHSLLMSNLITVVNSVTATIAHNAFQVQCGLPAAVNFYAGSNPPGTTYTWNFGDNSTTTGPATPVHNYLSTGCFYPTLTVSNGICSSTATVASCITVSDAPTAAFTIADPTNCELPFSPILTNQSTGLTSMTWNFGDGNLSSAFQPTPTYTTYQPEDSINYPLGVFPIVLNVFNPLGCMDSDTQFVYISNLNATILPPGTICAPDSVQFKAFSQNISPAFYSTSWVWDVDAGGGGNSSIAYAFYPDSGLYHAEVIVTDNIGCVDTAQRSMLVGIPPVIDSITTDTNFICRITEILFTGYGSSYIDSWAWSFSDTSFGSTQSFSHQFQDTGWISGYVLAGFRNCVTQMQLDSYYIYPPIALFSPQIICDSFLVDFIDESTGAHHWFWDFGDTTSLADTSSLQHPSYNYPSAGTYSVFLTVYNDSTGCQDTFRQEVTISKPLADFSIPDSLCTVATVIPTNLSIGATSYLWAASGSLPYIISAETPTFVWDRPGIFPIHLSAFDVNGCYDTLTKFIHIAGVDTNIVYSPLPACRPATVNFVDSSIGVLSPIVGWQWNTGSTQPSSTATYFFAGPQLMPLTVTNDWGCSFSLEKEVEVGGLFINFSATQNICLGDLFTGVISHTSPANANAYPPFTFVWDYGDGQRDTSQNPITNYTYTAAGVYDLCMYVIDSLGCVQELCAPAFVEVHDPTAVFTADTFFSSCPPLEVDFFNLSLSGSQWSWNFGDGSVSNLEHPTHVYSTPGFYNVVLEVFAFPGCSHIDTILQMIQISGPTGNFIMPPATSCAPFTAQFVGSGSDIETYTWLFGNGDSQSNTTNAPTDTSYYTYTQEGVYVPILVMNDSFGCQIPIEQDTIFINAPPLPAFSSDSLICQLDSIQYQTLTAITGSMSVEWLFEGGFPDSSTQLNPLVYYPDTGSFDVRLVVWEDGCSDTLLRPNYIQIKAIPTAHFGINITDTCAPVFVQFSDSSSAGQGSIQSWSWDFGNGQTASSPDSSLWYNVADSFDIQLVVENTFGCRDTLAQVLQTFPLPNGDAGIYPTFCAGDTVQLLGTGNANFNWSSAAWISDTSIANPLTVLDSSQLYILEVYNAFGCSVFDTIQLVAEALITVDAGDSAAICLGESILLQATGNTTSFDWGVDSSLSCQFCANPIASPSTTSIYYLQTALVANCTNMDSIIVVVHPLPTAAVTADSSICEGDSVQLLAAGGQFYHWLAGANLSNDSIPNPFANPSTLSIYTVEVVDSNNCKDSISMVVDVRSAAFNPLPDVTICLGDSTTFSLNNATNPVWTGDSISCINCSHPTVYPYNSSQYIVQYYNQNNCPVEDSIMVNVLDLTQLQALASDTICLGDSLQLNVLGNQGLSVLWQPNYALSNHTILNPIAFPTVDTFYVVQVVQGQCARHDSIFIGIQDLPNINATGAAYCIGDTAQLFASGNATAYLWTPSLFLSDSSLQNPQVIATQTQQYQVIGSSNCGADTAYTTVLVNGYPSMQLDSSAQAVMGSSIQLNSNASSSNTFVWSPPDDLSCINCANPSWTVSGDAVFYVTVTNTFGCSIMDSIVITSLDVCTPDLIFVPNAFSPDLDGNNDVLYVRSGIIVEIETFQIYSRWGQLLFETNDILEGWDGTFQGKPVPPDVFGYYVIFRCPSTQEQVLKKGNVTILR